jgi:CheY-like chemotaxis protein
MTRQALRAYHYEVLLANNGAEALEAYQNRTLPIDLIITDLQMPVMDGPSFVREMHRLDPRLKIICVSGLASESKLADLDRAKVSILLGKPYTAERLLKAIHQVLAP